MDMVRITEELEPWVQRIIDETVSRHIIQCPNHDRITRLELSFSKAVGMAVGAGAMGGLVVQLVGMLK
jgi:hypothetical protein